FAGRELRDRLCRERVEPAEPVGARDGDDLAVGEVDDGGTGCEGPLFADRVAVVLGRVADGAGPCGERGGHSTLPSRPDAWVRRSWPSAAMSHAHSRCSSTWPYMRVAALYSFAVAERSTASVARSMRGPSIAPRYSSLTPPGCTSATSMSKAPRALRSVSSSSAVRNTGSPAPGSMAGPLSASPRG